MNGISIISLISKCFRTWSAHMNKQQNKQTIWLKNEQKMWIDILPKKYTEGQWHIKRCLTSLTIRKMQIKTITRYYLTPVRKANIKMIRNNKCWWWCGEKGTLTHCWEDCKSVQPPWKTEAEPEMVPFLSVNKTDEAIEWRSSGTARRTQTLFVCVSRSVVSDSLQPHGLKPTRLLCPWDFPGKDIGVSCYFLLQGIFPTEGSNPGLLHCRQILYRLSYKGRPVPSNGLNFLLQV